MQYKTFQKVYDSWAFVYYDEADKVHFDYKKVSIVKAAKKFGNLNKYIQETADALDDLPFYRVY